MTVPMIPTAINGRDDWTLLLPEHRHFRREWPWFEAARLHAMRHFIGDGDVVFDIGAEEGDFPALWASWGAEVVLVEPNPRVWPNIRAIFEANGLDGQILAAFAGFAGPSPRDGDDGPGLLRAGWPDAAFGPIIGDHGFENLCERPDRPVTTVDLLADVTKSPTVITVDVEGAELEVMQGATATLAEHRPLVFISEHNAFMHDMYGYDMPALHGFMTDQGYERVFLASDHETHALYVPAERMWPR